MTKAKCLLVTIILLGMMFLIPNVSNAAVEVTKDIYANNGSAKYYFTGLTLDTSHEYEFGLTKTSAAEVTSWHLITEYTEATATVDISGANPEFVEVILAVDTGYITIKDKTTDTIVLQPYGIDLTIPYLNITNFTVVNNGKELNKENVEINFWNAGNSQPYYQYEKITDENIINKYKEIKNQNGNYEELQSLLKKQAPTNNWKNWDYWNGYGGNTQNGYGYPERTISVPDSGLYYMWIYVAGNNIKNLYGYILVDNLQPEIALDSISLPKTANVELGKTLTLTPTFSPANTTNKIVTWHSSDESVATVDNAGKITPLKIGSTIITVTSQDGSKTATCTVTVVESTGDNNQNDNNNQQIDNSNGGETTNTGQDTTVAPGTLPYAGSGTAIIFAIVIVLVSAIIAYKKYNKLSDIK